MSHSVINHPPGRCYFRIRSRCGNHISAVCFIGYSMYEAYEKIENRHYKRCVIQHASHEYIADDERNHPDFVSSWSRSLVGLSDIDFPPGLAIS